VLRWALAPLTALMATAAFAQLSGTASWVSDERVRGVSLSDGLPAGQLDVSYDHESGWYEGAFASNVRFYERSRRELELIGYTGYARRLQRGWSVDAGAAYATFSKHTQYEYLELHAGVTFDSLSARLYLSPNYYGEGIHTLYAELNGSRRLVEPLRLIGHAGLLQPFGSATDERGSDHLHTDFLAGVEYQRSRLSFQVARVFNDGASSIYPVSANHTHGVLTVRISIGF
jgi:uncharacterized protein (TIGR02001 family)